MIYLDGQNSNQLCYKIVKDIYTNYKGAAIVLRKSKNPKAMANAEELLGSLKKCFDDLLKKIQGLSKASYFATAAQPKSTSKSNSSGNVHVKSHLDSKQNNSSSQELVSFWPKRSGCTSREEYENAVERFFHMPEVAAIKEKMEDLEEKWRKESIVVIENAAKFKKTVAGYVYALYNPLFPDLLKIGATFRTPEIRARELSGTGIPEPFTVVAELKCSDPFITEREVHYHFATVRKYGRRKEFFTLAPETARKHFQSLKEKAMQALSKEAAARIAKRLKRMKKTLEATQEKDRKSKNLADTSKFDRARSIVKDAPGLQALTAEVVKYQQSVDACTESLVRFKTDYGPSMGEISEFMSFVIDKAPAFKESMAIMSEAKERYVELEKLASVSAKENAEREINVEKLKDLKTEMELRRRQSLLKMEEEEFKFSQYKKHALEEAAEGESQNQQNKKKQAAERRSFVCIE